MGRALGGTPAASFRGSGWWRNTLRLCDLSALFSTIVPMLALSQQTGVTLAEVGFLLMLFAGVWLVAAQIRAFKKQSLLCTSFRRLGIFGFEEDRPLGGRSTGIVVGEVGPRLAVSAVYPAVKMGSTQ
jgi:hypothetical protein